MRLERRKRVFTEQDMGGVGYLPVTPAGLKQEKTLAVVLPVTH